MTGSGWLRPSRGAHPTDRRATLVSLTQRGQEAASWMAAERRTSAQALLGDLDPAQLTAFVTVADRLVGHLAPRRDVDRSA